MHVSVNHILKTEALERALDSLDAGCYVFGGCVRDRIAGKEFKDIDAFFKDLSSYNAFISKMQSLGYTTKFQRMGKYVKRGQHKVLELSKRNDAGFDNIICNIDCVIGNGNQEGHMLPIEWDADVNAISLNKFRQVSSLIGLSDAALAELIRRIQKHIFMPLPGMTEYRKQKLLKKGFKEKMSAPLPTDEQSFFESFKNDVAPEVAYRVTANQLVKATKQGALLAVAAKGGNSETAKTVSEILNTEAGDIAVSAMLMALCMFTPQLNQNPKVKRLAREFQVSGLATGANALLDVAREFLLPGLLDALKKLPDAEETTAQTRVAASAPTQLFPESVSEEEEIVTAPQKRAATR